MKNPLPAIFGRLRQGGPDAFESGKDSPLGARTSRSSRAGGSSFPNHPHHRLARQIPSAAAAFMLLAPPVVPAAPDASATPGALTTPAASVARPAPATHPASPIPPADTPQSAEALFAEHCAACHGADRLGGAGPALLPGNLKRLRRAAAATVIAEGRPATQMPGFSGVLGPRAVEALVDLIYTPPETVPRFGMAEIERTRVVHRPPDTLGGEPVFAADPLSLFIVVEQGDHHATVLDGDHFEPVHRFPTRYALHGGPKFSPDGRFVYLASRDGWITQYDLYNLVPVAEIRAGINTRNLAVSCAGRYVMVANYLPHTLVLLDARALVPLAVVPVEDDRGETSRVSAVYAAPPRGSFVAALKDLPEVWEIPCLGLSPESFVPADLRAGGRLAPSGLADRYPESAAPHEDGLVPDGSADQSPESVAPRLGRLGRVVLDRADRSAAPRPDGPAIRRLALDGILDDFFFDPAYAHLIGASRDGFGQVVALDSGRRVADIDLPGLPHLGSGITWETGGRTVLATPNLKESVVSVIDMTTWRTVKRIHTLGPGFFMRSHERSRYAWVDVFFGPHRDAVHVIDKSSLEIVETLRPEPGKTAAHVEFTRDGRYALLSIRDVQGAVVVYDADTLEEVKRIPMSKPSGKYNVYNRITRSRGTSH